MAYILLAASCVVAVVAEAQRPRATITVNRSDSIGFFDPLAALGSTIDGHVSGSTRDIFTSHNVAAMKSANFHPISYRLRTELGMEAWHWNPRGQWSDPAHKQGYWTSDDHAGTPIQVSYGYRLPRRGNTIDQGNGDGYSRLTDGDTASFWKSNPYLDARYTHDSPADHPQWVIVDMGSDVNVNAIQIRWGVPYATRYRVQYWPKHNGEEPTGPDDDVENAGWTDFDSAAVRSASNASDANAPITLAEHPVHTRWIRVLMLSSSYTALPASHDARDSVGFAIREISVGTMANGVFRDITHHSLKAAKQTRTYASSTDPWHRASDRDSDTEQPGIDLMFSSGITRNLPMLTPVGVLYDTPANAAALLRYVRQRHYSVPRLELGEEPDGQFVAPDDFAALYIQVADSLRAVEPGIELGGPSLQDGVTKVMMSWKVGTTDQRSWFDHFRGALDAHGHVRDLAFVSFEFYPYDEACTSTAPQLADVPELIHDIITQFRSDGVHRDIPLLMTEYGYSAFATQSEMSLPGAILNTEAVAEFLTGSGAGAFFYGTEPSNLDRNPRCNSWGDNTLFLADDSRRIRAKNATYYSARMLTTLWADSSGGPHTMIATSIDPSTGSKHPLSAYSVRRPDGRVAILIINRSPNESWAVDLRGMGDTESSHAPALSVWRFSRSEYTWHQNGEKGYAKPNTGPSEVPLAVGAKLVLPPYSIFVVRER